MSVGIILTQLSLSNSSGVDVPLISPTRAVQTASGLAGINSREVIIARSGRRGSRNLTRYRDDAQIVLNGMLMGNSADNTWSEYDAVAGAFADAVDTDQTLKWTAGNGLALQRTVRLTSLDSPLSVGPDVLSYQATLRGSDPNVYSQIQQESFAVPLGSTSGGGFTFPFTFPFHFQPPASTVAAYTNGGFIPTPPILTLNGFLSNPVIQLEPGIEMVFNGSVAASDQLIIDADARTIMLNSTVNRLSLLDAGQSTWFDLPPGSGTITLLAEAWSAGAGLSITWRDARS